MKSSRADSPIRIDMLNGGLFRKILMFALPLMASGILQQSFNSIDVAVVGRFASSQALAAVGSNGMIISIMVNLFLGISVGANVVISNYIGQRNEQGIRKAVRTVSFIALWSGLLLLVLGVSLARPILELMNTPHDVIDLATLYLRIYFLGMPFMMIYNFGAAILRSMGDTKRPFYSLIAAGIINTGLNLVLVIGFEMSVAGVAIATVASNIVSASIIVFLLLREKEPFRLEWKKITVERNEFRHMLRIGVPAGVQGMVFSFANIFVQSSINGFGSDAVAGSAAAINYEYYCFFVISAFAQAAVAFVSQNYGAGQIDRCKKSVSSVHVPEFSRVRIAQRADCLAERHIHRYLHLQSGRFPLCRPPPAMRAAFPVPCQLLRNQRRRPAWLRLFHDPHRFHHFRHLRPPPGMDLYRGSPPRHLRWAALCVSPFLGCHRHCRLDRLRSDSAEGAVKRGHVFDT